MIYKLTPACKEYIWGGTNLKQHFGKISNTATIAETWELSCHKNGGSTLSNGQLLAEFLSKNPSAAGVACQKFGQFPLLVKLIDAASDLSVQVHPNDEYAKIHENQLGKTEMWYVVQADEGASLYCGFKNTVSKIQYEQAIENGTLCELLNKVPVKKGDMFFIEAGTIHAIGAGILIAEIQQSSDVTYRVFDYKRKDANGNERELHVEKALSVTSLEKNKDGATFAPHLAKCDYFTVDFAKIHGTEKYYADETSFKAVLVTDGNILVKSENAEETAEKGSTLFIPANSGEFEIIGNGEALIIYVS